MRVVIVSILLFAGCLSVNAQVSQDYYQRQWKKMDSLLDKHLIRSALDITKEIYNTAKKEVNNGQVIGSLLCMTALEEGINENSFAQQIPVLERELKTLTGPARYVLHNIIAQQYWLYFQMQRWNLYDRTETVNFNKEDIDTWGQEDFHKAITEHFLQSLADIKQLQQTGLEEFNRLIVPGNMRQLRPTLFDLLSHRALDYFEGDERELEDFRVETPLADAAAFADAPVFAKDESLKKSLSKTEHALNIFQELLAFHLNDADHNALIDVDLRRLNFARRRSSLHNKDSLYLAALSSIVHKYPNARESAMAWYHIADLHAVYAGEYDSPTNNYYRHGYITARSICEKVLSSPDSSAGKFQCEILLHRILQKGLSLEAERVNSAHLPFRVLVKYKNIDQLHCRIIKMTPVVKDMLPHSTESYAYWPAVLRLKPVRSFVQPLPASGDHRDHSAEIKIDALPPGEYALLTSNTDTFKTETDKMSIVHFHVSSIAYVYNDNDLFVLDRETGKPIKNASVQFWQSLNDYRSVLRLGLLTTDSNGHCKVSKPEDGGIRLEIRTPADSLFIDDDEDISVDYEPDETRDEAYEEEVRETYFFSDRSIYRPGQTVYFKGISITNDAKTEKPKIVAGKRSRVILFDVNDQAIDSLDVVTNEFGAFSGSFRLPVNTLTGSFSIEEKDDKGSVIFSVEEYKRPKFSVGFIEPTESYRLNDSVNVSGFAQAYAGNNISNARVKYRIVRIVSFPYQWRSGRWRDYSSATVEIAHGETITGVDGKFHIRFNALADPYVSKDSDPVFTYTVYAEVTDINGETHTASTWVEAGYKALILSVKIPDEAIPSGKLKNIELVTTNMNRKFQRSRIHVEVYRLNAPQRLIRARYWAEPDQHTLTQAEYLQYFPHDEYSDETNKEKWEKLEKVFDRTDFSNVSSLFTINTTLAPGWYAIEVTAWDTFGETVKEVEYIQLYDDETGNRGSLDYKWPSKKLLTAQPGDTATLRMGSSATDVFVIQYADRPTENIQPDRNKYQCFSLAPNGSTLRFPVTEADRGDFTIAQVYIKHNRVYYDMINVAVPWTNKQLTIHYETFRDKTLPGSDEKWKVKISGSHKEKVAAEILTALYDASLDEISSHDWEQPDIWPRRHVYATWRSANCFESKRSVNLYQYYNDNTPYKHWYAKSYDAISAGYKLIRNWDGSFRGMGVFWDLDAWVGKPYVVAVPDWQVDPDGSKGLTKDSVIANGFKATGGIGNRGEELIANKQISSWGATKISFTASENPGAVFEPERRQQPVQIRKNFTETAFFFPDLRTDSAGNVEFSFTMPDALTKWKWMLMAHTKDLSIGYNEKYIITQKELMVQPNVPRFLREGDKMYLNAKIANIGNKEASGEITMQLLDAATNQVIDSSFVNLNPTRRFSVEAGQSTFIKFPVSIPSQFNSAVAIRFIAKAGSISDGEENTLPVLSNRILMSETFPLNVPQNGDKNFKLDKLITASNTITHHRLTVEIMANPAWQAVQSLPYLMEYPYECSEQLWNRVYSNALSAAIINSSPRIKNIFDKWASGDSTVLMSNLQKNLELKSVLLEETPWVLEAKNENQQKKNIALLFNMVRSGNEMIRNLERVQQRQLEDGGFSWFPGGKADRYISQYILTGIGRLKKLNAIPAASTETVNGIIRKGLSYLDRLMKADHNDLTKIKADLSKQQIHDIHIHYLYMRSFFPDIPIDGASEKAVDYYRKQAQKSWQKQNRYMQGMTALALFRAGDGKTATDILRALKETAIVNDELGMYWKDMSGGYYWHQAPIETQALLIEAFSEITKDLTTVDALRTWLLKNKQTNNWITTKATADACYALLLQGTDWLTSEPVVHVTLGDKTISSLEHKTEAGSGYFKHVFDAPSINNTMGNISINITQPKGAASINQTSWGAVYWQYFENLENITPAATPLKLTKKLFVERNTGRGPVLDPVEENVQLKTGDKIKVRIELRVDRDMEYVHMKDMRAASLEPANVLSSYKWQGGLGYYESTRDASTNFFFSYLLKGTYVFEYLLFVTHPGTFNNGITTIQCMYAPEFSSHSEGVKINVVH